MSTVKWHHRIFWDASDPQNEGWAYSTWRTDEDGRDFDASGPLNVEDNATDDELVTALREEYAGTPVTFDDLEIVRTPQ